MFAGFNGYQLLNNTTTTQTQRSTNTTTTTTQLSTSNIGTNGLATNTATTQVQHPNLTLLNHINNNVRPISHTNLLYLNSQINNTELLDNNETTNTKNKLPVEHDAFYNMKPLLAENILSSDYFKSLFRFKTYTEVVDEAIRFVKNLEPLMVGLSRKPSTAFCILYKLMTLNLTIKQVNSLIDPDKQDNNYVRGVGFLYLRYLLPRKLLWKWYEIYFDDESEFAPGSDGKPMKMGDFVRNLIEQQKYYNTLLPRIPVRIERAYKKRLLQMDLVKKRDIKNEIFRYKLKEGMKIEAQWRDYKFYNAKIIQLLDDGMIKVNFIEYDDDDDDIISIGQIKLIENKRDENDSDNDKYGHRSRKYDRYNDRDRDHRGMMRGYRHRRSRSRDRDRDGRRSRSGYTRSRSRDIYRDRDRRRIRNRSRDRHTRDDDRIRDIRHHERDRELRDHHHIHHERHRIHDKIIHENRKLNGDEYDLDNEDLDELIKKKERDKVVAQGRDYARRPTAYYHSLTLDLETGTNRKRSPDPPINIIPRKKKTKQEIIQNIITNQAKKQPSKEWIEQQKKIKTNLW